MLHPTENETTYSPITDPSTTKDPVTQDPPVKKPNGNDPDDPILVKPIISSNKLTGFISSLSKKGIKWDGLDSHEKYIRNRKSFKHDLAVSYLMSDKPQLTDEEFDNLYDSFRDLEAEQQERDRLSSLYMTQRLSEEQINQSGVNSQDIVDDAGVNMDGDNVKTAYKDVKATNSDVKKTIKDYTRFSGGMDVKFDTQIAVRNMESRGKAIGEDMAVQQPDYQYIDYDGDMLKIYDDNDVYQNIYRGNRYKAFQNLPSYNYDFDVDGTFGQVIESLDFNFILQEAPRAAELFNEKFSAYGYSAEGVIETDVPGISKPRHSVKIYGQDGNLLMSPVRVYGSEILGLNKEQLVDFLGVKEETDPGNLLQTIIRPQVYTQQYGNFITEFKSAVQNDSPAANFGYGFNKANQKLMYSLKKFDSMIDIGPSSSQMIVNILNEVGFDMNIDDAYRNYRSGDDELLFDGERVSGFLTLAREKLRSIPDTPGREIRLKQTDIQLDRDGVFGSFQYEYDLGVNTAANLTTILNQSSNPNDYVIDRYGNKEKVKNILLKSLDKYSNMIRRNKDNTSRSIGHGLKIDGGFRDIPLTGIDAQIFVSQLQNKGFDFFNHMPTDGITIDGVPSTYEQVFNIVTDPSLNNKARLGEIDIQIGNPENFGFMEQPIKAAKFLMNRNNTNFEGIFGYRNQFTNTVDQTYEWAEDLFQSVGIEFLNAGASLREINKDLLIGFGMSEEMADYVSKGPNFLTALPGAGVTVSQPGKVFTKEYVNSLREEFLPLWTTSIANASGDDGWKTFGEIMMLGNQPLGGSLPYMGAILLNPYFGVATIGMNAYGESLYNYKADRKRLQNAYDAGVPLTEVEMNMMESTNNDIRLIAGANGTIEAGMTALFTTRYLHGSKVWNKVLNKAGLGKTPPSSGTINELSKQMSFRFDKGFNASFNRLVGIEGKALVYENVEEGNIAFWKYQVESLAGIREFDYKELGMLLKETSYHASFSSLGLAGAMRLKGNKNLGAMSEIVMQENIGTSNLYKQTDLKLNISESLSKYIANKKAEGATDKAIESSNYYKWATDFIAKTDKTIKEITDSRKRLIASLDKETKLRFITLLGSIENKNTIIENTEQNSDARIQALNDLKKEKAELADIIGKTANPDAFQFLPFDKQSSYLTQAFSEINFDEMKKKDPSFTEAMWQNAIKERAKELYVIDAKSTKSSLITVEDGPGDIASAFGNTDVNTIIQTSINPEFLENFDLQEQLELASQKILDSYGIEGNAISGVREDGSIVERDKDENSTPLDDSPATDAELAAETEQQRIKKLRGKVNTIIDRIKGYKSSQNNEFLTSLDLNTKLDDLRAIRVMDFFQTLNSKENFSEFTEKDFQFQRIEAILDAHDIAVSIASNIDQGSIDPFKGNDFVRKTLEVYAGKSKLTNQTGIATLDILKNLVIRNKNAAVPFLNLYEEINRKVTVIEKDASITYKNFLDTYKKGRNKDKGFFSKKDIKSVDINDDYQMSLLAGLRRINLDAEDVNSEFSRYKKNVFEELQKRKEEMNDEKHSRYTKSERKERYELLKRAISDLSLEDAKSYQDVLKFARPYNVDLVNQISDKFAEGESQAKDRVYGFGQQWTNFRNYTPMFLTPQTRMTAEQINDMQYADTGSMRGGINTSGALQYATTPDSYLNGTNFRLQFGGFLTNASKSLRGSQIDATTRKDMQTMVELFNNPSFSKLFKNEQDFKLMKGIFATELNNRFNYKVNEGRNPYTDFGDVAQWSIFSSSSLSSNEALGTSINDAVRKVVNTTLGAGAAVSLASLTQPVQQYYSAIANHMIRAENPEVRAFYIAKMAQFTAGIAGTANGGKRTTMVGKFVQDIFGQGDKSNIYNLSQVSLRNSLRAELPLQQDGALDASYYEKSFNLPTGFFGKYGVSGKLTFDRLMDKIQSNSELSLNFFLARTDKIAANAAFEGHYLDYKIKNGSKYPSTTDSKGRQEWWKKENANPDTEAINYADNMVKEVMRPSSSLTEAQAYTNTDLATKLITQTLFPFAKFSINAKTQFWTQYSLANDTNLPADQRAEARRAMQGIMAEMAVFQSSKTVAQAAIYGTLGETLLGFDEEEIERYGGLQAVMFELILPLDDREFMKKVDKLYNDREGDMNSLEGLNAYQRMVMNHKLGEDMVQNFEDLQNFGNTYGNKSDLSPKNNNVMQMVIGDMLRTLNPVVVPDAATTFLFSVVNFQAKQHGLIQDDKIFLEFASEDFDKDGDGEMDMDYEMLKEFVGENLGLLGVTVQQKEKVSQAIALMKRNSISKKTPTGAIQTQYVGTGNELLNKKVDQAIGFVFIARMLSAFNMIPGAPNAELNKITDRVYRGLEKYINETESSQVGSGAQNTPDPEMKTGYMRYFETLDEQKQKRFETPLPQPKN